MTHLLLAIVLTVTVSLCSCFFGVVAAFKTLEYSRITEVKDTYTDERFFYHSPPGSLL